MTILSLLFPLHTGWYAYRNEHILLTTAHASDEPSL
jgi:hypothetical protein